MSRLRREGLVEGEGQRVHFKLRNEHLQNLQAWEKDFFHLETCTWFHVTRVSDVLGELKRNEIGKFDRGCLLFTH